MANLVLNNITTKPASYIRDANSERSNIVRLVEDENIKKDIHFDELSIADDPDPVTTVGGNRKETELGLMYPIIRINDIILNKYNISFMKISMRGFMPTITLGLMFDNTNFVSKSMPKDGDIVSVFIRSSTAALQYLRDDFIITSCSGGTQHRGEMTSRMTVYGRLFIEGFDSTLSVDAFAGSSKFVMKSLAQKFGLGFAYNDFDDTNDFMNWIQCRQSTQSFIEDVTSHAWKNETSFFGTWIDLYYNICFVNVNKFLLSTENPEEFDITFSSDILNMFNQIENDASVGNATMAVKVLTNLSDFKYTPFIIKSWEPVNNSSYISMTYGYSTSTYTFKHNQNLINQGDYDCFEEVRNIPAFDQNKTDSFILLRGRATYDKEKNPDDERARVNHEYIETYSKVDWTGVEYTMNSDDDTRDMNKWSGNVHKNYNRAPYHNNQNFRELDKIYLDVVCEGLNLQVMKGERIPVIIGFRNNFEQDMYNNASKNDLPSEINRFYSGYYIVDSVDYEYNAHITGSDVSPFTTRFILKRREWPTPEAIAKEK